MDRSRSKPHEPCHGGNCVDRPSEQGSQVGQCGSYSAHGPTNRRAHREFDGPPAASHSFVVGSLSPISSLLSRSWRMAASSDRIVIFDQGFLTALCSMALFAQFVDRSVIVRGLALIPRPNLLVRLDAPRERLEVRLRSRLARQGPVERLFEFDLQTSLRQIETINDVAHMLQEQGRRMIHVISLDRRLLEKAVDRIVRRGEVPGRRDRSVNRSLVERRRIVRVAR